MNAAIKQTMCMAAGLILLFAGSAAAQSVQLVDASFEPRRATLVSISDAGVTLGIAGEEEKTIEPGELVRMKINPQAEPAGGSGRFVLILRNGDRLYGTVESLDETGVAFTLASFGSVRVPLENLAMLLRAEDEAGTHLQPAPAADELLLMNGDRLSGFASEADAKQWLFVDGDGQENRIDTAAVRRMRFADPGVPVPEPAGAWRAQLADGSVLTAEELQFSDGRFMMTYAGRDLTVPPEGVAWIEPTGGAAIWLTDLPLLKNEHTPYFGGTSLSFPAQLNPPGVAERAVVGKGLLVRSRSVVEVNVPDGATAFRTAFEVPAAQILANVDLRIRLDDEVVWEQAGVTAGQRAEPVKIELDDAQRLTLEVDYGQGLDVQDRLFWLDPAFLME